MPFYLKNPHTDLDTLHITTERCILVPFSLDTLDIEDLQQAFCEANKDLYVSPHLPTVDEEREFIEKMILERASGDALEFFILAKDTQKLLGCAGINALKTAEPNIGLWIRVEHQGQGLGSEVYGALLSWARENTSFTFFRHCCDLRNTGSMKLAEKNGGILQTELNNRGGLKYSIFL